MKVENCTIKGNKLNGLLIRDGASPQVLRTTVTNNSAFGIVLQVIKYSKTSMSELEKNHDVFPIMIAWVECPALLCWYSLTYLITSLAMGRPLFKCILYIASLAWITKFFLNKLRCLFCCDSYSL